MTSQSRSAALDELLLVDAASLEDLEAMGLAANLVDLGGDAHDLAALDHALKIIDHLEARRLSDPQLARLHYYRANAWNGRRLTQPPCWQWTSDDIDNELLSLRRATAHPGFSQLDLVQQAQIHTNHANILNHIGRFVEAVEAWDQALALVPKMAMANGNRGIGLTYYAGQLYDPGHNGVLAAAARASLGRASASDALVDSDGLGPALASFKRFAASIDAQINVGAIEQWLESQRFSLGRSAAERRYREWCLKERLFLNPLNDIGPDSIAAHDVLTLPTLVEVGLGKDFGPPTAIRHYNVLKQEYVTARYALHEALTTRSVHFSDRGVLLHDTLDFPAFGFAVERGKLAFRTAYALLDKIAYFLNDYLGLGHSERQVSFRNVWFEPKRKNLHPRFVDAANWPLRGLFWLSKDIFDDAFRSVTTPDARELYDLRNHLEHKFVSVHDDVLAAMALSERKPADGLYDIDFSDLTARALRQLKLSRAALIYLSLGVHAEEARREAARGPDGLSVAMPLYTVRDADKRRDCF